MTVKKRKSYSKQFKTDAVKLVVEQGRTAAEVSRNLDISLTWHPPALGQGIQGPAGRCLSW